MVTIRYAEEKDRAFWHRLDRHLSEAEFMRKVRDGMGYVLCEDSVPVGILRYGLFWDNTPFCNLLFIESAYRKRGYGRMLLSHWEEDMQSLGYGMVMTSTQVDETAQHFYRKLGYRDAGGLLLDVPGYEQPMELFLVKAFS